MFYIIQVYDVIKKDPEIGNETFTETYLKVEENEYAVIEFHSPTIAVRENIGTFPVTIWRHGNLNTRATVR